MKFVALQDLTTMLFVTPMLCRGREKVNPQWSLYCMVHNIEKLAKSGYAQ